MKKRPAAKKPAARKSVAKKSSTRSSKPAKPPAKAGRSEAPADGGRYTPTPIQGIGWAPFRYPL